MQGYVRQGQVLERLQEVRYNFQIFSKEKAENDEADRISSHGLLAVTSHNLKGVYILSREHECMEMMNTLRKEERMKAKEKSIQMKKKMESNENMHGN
jgi:PHD/YefM family antitoxin component YafN of YafNO toxin-antitoxin module